MQIHKKDDGSIVVEDGNIEVQISDMSDSRRVNELIAKVFGKNKVEEFNKLYKQLSTDSSTVTSTTATTTTTDKPTTSTSTTTKTASTTTTTTTTLYPPSFVKEYEALDDDMKSILESLAILYSESDKMKFAYSIYTMYNNDLMPIPVPLSIALMRMADNNGIVTVKKQQIYTYTLWDGNTITAINVVETTNKPPKPLDVIQIDNSLKQYTIIGRCRKAIDDVTTIKDMTIEVVSTADKKSLYAELLQKSADIRTAVGTNTIVAFAGLFSSMRVNERSVSIALKTTQDIVRIYMHTGNIKEFFNMQFEDFTSSNLDNMMFFVIGIPKLTSFNNNQRVEVTPLWVEMMALR